MHLSIYLGLVLVAISTFTILSNGQETSLDRQFRGPVRMFRKLFLNFVGRTGESQQVYEINRRNGKLQKHLPKSTPFICDINGPGRRSSVTPTSVHQLRPGDIDIVAAMGDSLTAGNGALSTNILQVLTENKGVSWSIGGQADWRKFLTLPNILKEYNPKLYGYSLRDGLSSDRSSRFNVAEPGAMSRDMPHQAQNLVKRMRSDPNVNMTHHWKLVTILIGPNDFCGDMCYYRNPAVVIDNHERDLIRTFRTLRNNIPRLMVNLVATPSMKILTEMRGTSPACYSGLHVECPCMFGTRVVNKRRYFFRIMEDWQERQKKVTKMDEFHNSVDFTVNYQIFTKNFSFPTTKNGLSDFTYMSTDCFHLSQKGYARAVNALWNNMLEPYGTKTEGTPKEFENFKCPTEEQPYLMTKENSALTSEPSNGI